MYCIVPDAGCGGLQEHDSGQPAVMGNVPEAAWNHRLDGGVAGDS